MNGGNEYIPVDVLNELEKKVGGYFAAKKGQPS